VCYPNTAATAPHKLPPRSTRCVFLVYSSDHKGYRCLDLSTNRLIVCRHVVFDEDNFPLATLPNLTDLDFLLEYDSTVSTVGPNSPYRFYYHGGLPARPGGCFGLRAPCGSPAHTGSPFGISAPCGLDNTCYASRGQVSPAAPRLASPTLVVPHAALESPTAPHVEAAPPTVTDGPPPHEWSSSPIVYTKRP
jgi:hypothetical protein